MAVQEEQMRAAADAAAQLIVSGMRVGLGTGRTVARLLPALAARGLTGLRCVATSPETEAAATALGLAAERFVVIVSEDKLVDRVRAPVPLELDAFGLQATLHAIGAVTLRAGTAVTPEGGVIGDYTGPIADPGALAAWLDAIPGVAGHGLFAPGMIHDVFVGGRDRPLQRPGC
jgi:ribose 5-phosphate isomerase A